ncbi:metal ABC transporter permease [Pseudoclavibacter alba]|uniref:Metal ABC transporter permease n=1 Tax=Pseudoclavibacter albus TaxID=272241 RepID=A0ABT2HX61_9MICO|nr:metal ABC transporter permease [Pseudoclavibacter alba]MBN6777088.1 metal ABC transporter permease [Pseudoclavibacter alba]MCT2042904.1 metal ABC transporter permease [Pseudoclavibacter alba]
MNPLDLILTPLGYPFVARAVIAAVLIGATCGVLSCFLATARWSLMSDAVAHSVLPGVVIAAALGAMLPLGAFLAGLFTVLVIGLVRSRTRLRSDAAIGVVFTTMFAAGLVGISKIPSQLDLQHIIFGNILGVGTDELGVAAVLAPLVIAVLLAKRRDLLHWAVDPEHARVLGLRVDALQLLLLVALAATVVLATQLVGVVLVTAMTITPGAIATVLSRRFERRLVLAPVAAIAAAFLGVLASFWLDVSTAGAIVCTLGLEFALAAGLRCVNLQNMGKR